MGEIFEGWEGSLLYSAEVTAGTPVAPATAFGYVKSVQAPTGSGLEEEGAVGTWLPVSLEEGVIEAGGSCEILPINATALLIAKRNGSTGKLGSYTFHASGGGTGINQTGCKVNQLRGQVDAGGRLRMNMDWFALSSIDNARIAPVLPTDEIFSWVECVHSLSGEIAGLEWTINHNVQRRPVIAGTGTTMPVTGVNRTPYRLKEGRQSAVRMTLRFFERPSENVIADLLTEIASMTLTATGDVTGDELEFSFTEGKPARRELTFGEATESLWPLELAFKDWDVAFTPAA